MARNTTREPSPQWAAWIRQYTSGSRNRGSKWKIAQAARVDPSYITLMSRDGYVPMRDVVIRVADAVGASRDEALLVAGFAPESVSVEQVLEILEDHRANRLHPRLLDAVREALSLEGRDRKQAEVFLSAAVAGLRSRRKP